MSNSTTTRAADASEINRFVRAMFRHAAPGGRISLRAFDDAKGGKSFGQPESFLLNGSGLDPLVARAVDLATQAASADRPIVFCPPLATFNPPPEVEEWRAKQEHLYEGLALSVECDEAPGAAERILRDMLGRPSVVVESGGLWIDPATGEVENKRHLHWRLTVPTRTAAEHAELKRARRLATELVGGDTSNIPLVHPIRWPGSWHRKAEPRLARIVEMNDGTEIALAEALEALEAATTGSSGFDCDFNGAPRQNDFHIDTGSRYRDGANSAGDSEPTEPEIEEALNHIDPDLSYDDWIRILMALHAHFDGSAAGLAMADRWSGRGKKYTPSCVSDRWKGFTSGGATTIRTVFAMAKEYGADPSELGRKHRPSPGEEKRAERDPGDDQYRGADERRDRSNNGNGADKQHQNASWWPAPDMSLLESERRPAPPFPADVFGAWADWIDRAAEVKNAPPDYVAMALLAVAGSLLGNARWAAPRPGWSEPPVLWSAIVGDPSAGKSPASDAVMELLKEIGLRRAKEFEGTYAEWQERAEVAKLSEAAWKEQAKLAVKANEEVPEKPDSARIDPEPVRPRLYVSDATTEKLGAILAEQWRGLLLVRDELSGWLTSLDRYSGGGDRPFWLEAYGGRSFSVERQKNPVPIIVDRLTIGVFGGIQPDRLGSLLLNGDDDGMLARFAIVWPEPTPLKRPTVDLDQELPERAFERLLSLEPIHDENGVCRPWFVTFDEPAQQLLHDFMVEAREWEAASAGLMKSHIGKFRGLAVRLAVVFLHLDWALTSDPNPPGVVTPNHLGRACHMIAEYLMPMAMRAYGDAAAPAEERGARTLARLIVDEKWTVLNSRDVQRKKQAGVRKSREIDAALSLLVESGWIIGRRTPTGGRTRTDYDVNPLVHGGAK